MESKWKPLESDPESLTHVRNESLSCIPNINYHIPQLAHRLGLKHDWALFELYSLEEEFLNGIPQPVLALILLYPDSEGERIFK